MRGTFLRKTYLSNKDDKIPKTHVLMKRNKKYVFQYGMVHLPAELSQDNFVGTYSRALLTGSPCTTQSATMKKLDQQRVQQNQEENISFGTKRNRGIV